MRRRQFITGLGAAAAWPLTARAQQAKVPVVGYLSTASAEASLASTTAFLQGLKEGGYINGQNLVVEYRWTDGHNTSLPALAADLVRRQVNAIMANGTPAALAAKAATTTIPIVFQAGAGHHSSCVRRCNRRGPKGRNLPSVGVVERTVGQV